MNHLEKCLECGGEITMTMCQQSLMLDGVWYPLHVGCCEVYLEKEIDVATVDHDGDMAYTEAWSNVSTILNSMEPDDVITITRRKMKRGDFLRLPEL